LEERRIGAGKMKRKFRLQVIIGLVLALIVTSGLYAFTYLSATATMDVVVAGAEIATADPAAVQPDWNSVIPVSGAETLRPNALGDEALIGVQFPDSGEHWDKVDEATSDGDSTYVQGDNEKAWQEDLYNIADHSAGSGTIHYVKVYVVCSSEVTPAQTTAYIHIKTNGVEHNGSQETMTTSYATYSYQWNTNPQTLAAWTWAEIDALQIGVGLREPTKNKYIRCTQVYTEIGYTPFAYGDVPTGDLFDITPHTDYTGDFAVKVYLTNTGNLIKAYQYLNMKLHLPGSVEAGETPSYQLLTLDNGEVTFNMKDYTPGSTYTLSVTGGSYCLVSTDTSQWEEGWTVAPEFYCLIMQR